VTAHAIIDKNKAHRAEYLAALKAEAQDCFKKKERDAIVGLPALSEKIVRSGKTMPLPFRD
jgi:hypothetical protein